MLIPSQNTILFLKVTLSTSKHTHTLKAPQSSFYPLSQRVNRTLLISSVKGCYGDREQCECVRLSEVFEPVCVLISSLVLSGHVSD